jgi:hypothetical protein
MNGPEELIAQLRKSIANGTFVKLILSRAVKPRVIAPSTVLSHRVRLVELKRGTALALSARTQTQETSRNLDPEEGCLEISRLLDEAWPVANLFTTTADWTLEPRPDGSHKIQARRASITSVPPPQHDRAKSPGPRSVLRHPIFHAIGLTDRQGEPAPSMGHKVRQITRFIERIETLLNELPNTNSPVPIVDFGSGKAYLTFALAIHLANTSRPAELTGIELREDLARASETLAREHTLKNLRFTHGSLTPETPPPNLAGGVVIALHACDTATDQALALGIRSKAALLVTSPCCHKECRPQLTLPESLQPLLSEGILRERFAEMCTDTLRRLLLETQGYQSTISELVDPEDSGKNLLLTGILAQSPNPHRKEKALRELQTFAQATGIQQHHLATLLSVTLPPNPCKP